MHQRHQLPLFFLGSTSALAAEDFASHGWTIPREHHLGCLWNFRTSISICLSSEGSLKGNRYANTTSLKALNPPEDQVLTGQQCFRSVLVAHDLQEKFLRFYQHNGIPPIEEVLWITGLPVEGQEELWEICPGMLITALFFHSELRFSLRPRDLWGQLQRSRARSLLWRMAGTNGSYERDHYRVTLRTWPISAASARSLKLQKALTSAKRSYHQAVGERSRSESVDIVVVFCHGHLDWLDDLTFPSKHRVLVYLKCSESKEHSFCAKFHCKDAAFLDARDAKGGIRSSDECGGYLLHIQDHLEDLSDWTIFLQDDAPRHLHLGYLNLVLKLLGSGTFSSLAGTFLHLNNDRHLLYWTPCLESLMKLLDLPPSNLLATYCCAQFVVHRSQISKRGAGFFQKASTLLKENLEDIPGCQYHGASEQRRTQITGIRLEESEKGHERAVDSESSTFQMRLCHLYDALIKMSPSESFYSKRIS